MLLAAFGILLALDAGSGANDSRRMCRYNNTLLNCVPEMAQTCLSSPAQKRS